MHKQKSCPKTEATAKHKTNQSENNKNLKKELFKKRPFLSWKQTAISCQQVEIQIDKGIPNFETPG